MKNTLLIGNGLNRCLPGGIPWENLLEDMAKRYSINTFKDVPMPLEFERLVNMHLSQNNNNYDDVYKDEKIRISDKIKKVKLPQNALHRKILDLPISSIITTNYDSLLEEVYSTKHTLKNKGGNIKYLEESTGLFNGVKFFHCHGHADIPNTICLGYEHYMGIVERMRRSIKAESGKSKTIREILLGNELSKGTWYERFFTTNIAIVGLGLYQCEVDLWWLLTQRASWYYNDYQGMKKIIRNRIVYYDIIDDIEVKDPQKERLRLGGIKQQMLKKTLLEGMHVDYKELRLSTINEISYSVAYEHIIQIMLPEWLLKNSV